MSRLEDTTKVPPGASLTALIVAKAREAVELTERQGKLPWWHRKRRRLAREADAKMREGFALLTGEHDK